MYDHLPGGEILEEGLRDLNAGVRSVPAMLLRIAAPRLTRRGIPIPPEQLRPGLPEHELYELLVALHGPEAYRLYRSWIRRVVSLENALDTGSKLQSSLDGAKDDLLETPCPKEEREAT